MKNMLKPVAKSVLIPLGLTAAVSTTDAAIYAAIFNKMFGSGITTLIISNEKMNDIMKIFKSLEESGSLINGGSETINNEEKEQKGRFLGMLLYTSGASLLGNLLSGKDTITEDEGTIIAAKDLMMFIQDIIYLK